MTSVIGKIPLFPLPNGALLPGELMPLHIFEPRYCRMMNAVRRSDRLLAIGTLLPGWESDYHGNPPVAGIVGVGRLVKDRLNADGTSNIVLHGMVRGEITEEVDDDTFRQVFLMLRPDGSTHPAESYRLRRRLLQGLDACLGVGRLLYDVTASFDVGSLVDRIASSLELGAGRRVSILQAVDPGPRVEALLGLLKQRKHRTRLASVIPSLSNFTLSFQDAEDTRP